MTVVHRLAARGLGPLVVACVATGLLALPACKLFNPPPRQTPLPEGADPEQVIDADDPAESVTPLRPDELALVGKQIQAGRQQRVKDRIKELEAKGEKVPPQRKYNVVAFSGGATYGAYTAGVLNGWSESGLTAEQGGRPAFDVVTGISVGALIAPFAFCGPDYDCLLRKEFTTTRTEDIYVRRRSLRSLFSESIADNTPLRRQVEQLVDARMLARIVAEHDKGRRLYIGTTNIDTKRIVIWDIGAIAKRGTPQAVKLVHDVIVASTSIPGLFPAVPITVTIDGRQYEELHVDGSMTRSLFFRPPHFDPSEREAVGPDTLAGSNLYLMVAGKIDPAPAASKLRTLNLALDATNLLLYSLGRGDLYRMYTYCLLTGMNYRVTSIPESLELKGSGVEFDPVEMTKMFNAGYELGKVGDVVRKVPIETPMGEKARFEETLDGTAWRDVPPGLKNQEKQGVRTGTTLTLRPKANNGKETGNGARGPEPDKGAPVSPPVVPPIK